MFVIGQMDIHNSALVYQELLSWVFHQSLIYCSPQKYKNITHIKENVKKECVGFDTNSRIKKHTKETLLNGVLVSKKIRTSTKLMFY